MENLVQRNSNHYFWEQPGGSVAIDRAEFELAEGGRMEFLFSHLTESEKWCVIRGDGLPCDPVDRILATLGIPPVYLEFVQPHKWSPCDNAIQEYITSLCVGDKRGFLLMGPPGTGKTMALRYCAERLLTHSRTRIKSGHVRFVTHSRFAEMVYNRRTERAELELIQNVPYLLFDDLGRAYKHDYPISELDNLISYRQEKLLTTCITTNLPKATLEELGDYSRIYSRLKHTRWMRTALTLSGKDWRGEG